MSAKNALAGLRPSVPGANPVRVAAHLAKNHDVAKAAIMSAIEEAKKRKQEMWDSLRGLELSDAGLKSLSDESPIFKMYRGVAALDRTISELGHTYLVSRNAHLAWTLADKASREWEERNPLPAVVEAVHEVRTV